MKQIYQSKRFWAGITTVIGCIALIATGEKSLLDALPETIVGVVAFIQTIIALTSNSSVAIGNKVIN